MRPTDPAAAAAADKAAKRAPWDSRYVAKHRPAVLAGMRRYITARRSRERIARMLAAQAAPAPGPGPEGAAVCPCCGRELSPRAAG